MKEKYSKHITHFILRSIFSLMTYNKTVSERYSYFDEIYHFEFRPKVASFSSEKSHGTPSGFKTYYDAQISDFQSFDPLLSKNLTLSVPVQHGSSFFYT